MALYRTYLTWVFSLICHWVVTDSGAMGNIVDVMDPYVKLNSTQTYLNSFDSKIKRLIIENQMRYCPQTVLCTHMYPHYINAFVQDLVSDCDRCSCTDDCFSGDVCCPDVLLRDPRTRVLPSSCQPRVLSLPGKHRLNYAFTVSECTQGHDPFGFCGRSYKNGRLTLADMTPVTANKLPNINVFRNKYCAFCNGQTSTSLLYHTVKVNCTQHESEILPENDFLDLETFQRKCPHHVIEFNSSKEIYCEDNVVSTCNITGAWNVYDPDIELACLGYYLPFQHISHTGKIMYKNVFCLLCSGIILDTDNGDGILLYSNGSNLSGLLGKFNVEKHTNLNAYIQPAVFCFWKNVYYDKYENKCLRITCGTGRKYFRGQCLVDTTVTLSSIVYVIHITFNSTNTYVFTESIEPSVRSWINDAMMETLTSNVNVTLNLCERSVRISVKEDFTVLKTEARLQIHAEETHHPKEVADDIMAIFNNTKISVDLDPGTKVILQAMIVTMQSKPLSLQWSNACELRSGFNEGFDNFIDILSFRKCPMIDITNRTLPWIEVEDGLLFIGSTVRLSSSHYQLISQFGSFGIKGEPIGIIRLCISTYERLRKDIKLSASRANLVNMAACSYVLLLFLSFVYSHVCQ